MKARSITPIARMLMVTVAGFAGYLSLPPEEPLNLDDDIVRAKAVRWKPNAIEPLREPIPCERDPFEEVLVVTETGEKTSGESEPSSLDRPLLATRSEAKSSLKMPSTSQIREAVSLDGIGTTASQSWGILNGRVHQLGDAISIPGWSHIAGTLTKINHDSVVISIGDQNHLVHTHNIPPDLTLQ
ncbi:hypothetical protein [Rhodopirellula sp. MGV]|uniref:hypothetical protein n=1 Tax=Rhodopirellula sp. MGV TaxID=2023130 RepID=UPI000B966FC9|nr:hypothetical protein [Rhodopirellula sp. MGV]OYP29391.1 hypothetical protein CGZ80_24590 [Rhodopirellula sp. MGV]PNY35697.1 hypothetical protein C2E31_16545 [Rhodopirellula baltica]